jgi:UDP-3-O-[3-hydroxymyristoyl] glucosamine N-acyltransferase
MAAGGSGFAGHLEIAERTALLATNVILESITEPGTTWSNCISAQPARVWNRNLAVLRRLDFLKKQLFALDKTIRKNQQND